MAHESAQLRRLPWLADCQTLEPSEQHSPASPVLARVHGRMQSWFYEPVSLRRSSGMLWAEPPPGPPSRRPCAGCLRLERRFVSGMQIPARSLEQVRRVEDRLTGFIQHDLIVIDRSRIVKLGEQRCPQINAAISMSINLVEFSSDHTLRGVDSRRDRSVEGYRPLVCLATRQRRFYF